MEIRAYQESDLQAVILLWQECGLVVPQNNPKKDIARKLQVDPGLFLVGLIDGVIVATVMGGYEGHRGLVNYLAVKLTEQRKGYAQTMMESVEALLFDRGCPKINLQVRSTNPDVIAFYKAIGYGEDEVVSFGKRLIID